VSAKVGSASQGLKEPAAAAPTASRNTSSAVASLNRLSPSSTTMSRCGSPTCRSTEVAAAASGGATIAPSATAAAQGISGTSHRATQATAAVVSSTAATARPPTGSRLSRRSRGEES
jgi:hypothetical protein